MVYTLKNQELSISVSTAGGELQSIESQGVSYLWNGDRRFWGYRSPILFPIIGKLRNDYAVSKAGDIRLPKHGFARLKEWTCADITASSIALVLQEDAETLAMYPFSFRLQVIYSIHKSVLTVTFVIQNTDEKELPFTIGAHPAFHVPFLEENTEGDTFEDYRLSFAWPETTDCPQVDRNSGLIIWEQRNRLLNNQKELALNHALFRGDALLFTGLKSRSVQLYSQRSGHGVQMDFEDMPFFAVWTPEKDAPFFCLEPWTGTATLTSEGDAFEEKQGTMVLQPGEEKQLHYTITVF